MTKDEALKLALEALEVATTPLAKDRQEVLRAQAAIREALAEQPAQQEPICHLFGTLPVYDRPKIQPEQEPVAWLITDEKINSLQVDSIQRLIDRARHAHMTDIKLRINGQDEWHQADWLKHLTRTIPPQRKPLTDEEIDKLPWGPHEGNPMTFAEGLRDFARAIEAAHGIKENRND